MPFTDNRASLADTVRTALTVLAPTVAVGVIRRRPAVVAVADLLDADRFAARQVGRLREKYGTDLVRLRVPGRELALVLSERGVRRVLEEDEFTAANREKRAALQQFQPHGVLISQGAPRAERRQANESALATDEPVHPCSDTFTEVIRDEVPALLGKLTWQRFNDTWWRIVRRITLGDHARDAHELTDMLASLRDHANWSYAAGQQQLHSELFRNRLRNHLETGGLGARLGALPHAEDQVAHWLFAFDAAGMAAYRALALLVAHTETEHLREAVLESVRLWPTTPALLRDSTEETTWDGAPVPAGTAFLVFTPYFHRNVPFGDQFCPQAWLDGRAQRSWALVPFSAGPAGCPGRNVVLQVTSTLLAELLGTATVAFDGRPPLSAHRPMPATLSPFKLRFQAHRRMS